MSDKKISIHAYRFEEVLKFVRQQAELQANTDKTIVEALEIMLRYINKLEQRLHDLGQFPEGRTRAEFEAEDKNKSGKT